MKFSIITVCYNSEDTIIDTLNSVLMQDYNNIEHIIVDGGSTDNTIKIINEYPFINKKIILKKNSGIYDSMNIGIKNSSGHFITMLNSDDIYQNKETISDCAKKIKHTLKDNPNTQIYFSDIIFFSKTNKYDVNRYYSSIKFQKLHLEYGHMPPHPGSFISKKIYEENGNYEDTFKIAADFDLFFSLPSSSKILPK